MKLSDWHVLEQKDTKKRHILYGPVKEYIEELGPKLKDNYAEIPPDKWWTSEMMEITSNLLEDNNRHSQVTLPKTLCRIAEQAGITDKQLHTFMYLYMKEMFHQYGY